MSSPKINLISELCTTPLYKNEPFLRQKYEAEKLSARQIAVLISCSHDVINRALVRFGIVKRKVKPGYAPYGYKLHNHKIAPHVRQQNVIRQMRNKYERGWSCLEIAEHNNRTGVRSPSGNQKWSAEAVREILKRHKSP